MRRVASAPFRAAGRLLGRLARVAIVAAVVALVVTVLDALLLDGDEGEDDAA
ncbi:MAG: hypothetical protein WEC33_03515 [Dehalococcoidia bacterium]